MQTDTTIESLDAQQELALETARETWSKIGLSVAKTDHAAAHAAMLVAYKRAAQKPPPIVIWLGSPRAGATAERLLHRSDEWPEHLSQWQRTVWDHVWKQCIPQVEQHYGPERWHEVRKKLRQDATCDIENKWGQYVEKQVKELFSERMGIWIWRYLRKIAGGSRKEIVRTAVEQHVNRTIESQISQEVSDRIFQQLITPLRQQHWDPVVEPLKLAIAANNGSTAASTQLWNCCYGLHDANWLSYYDFVAKLGVKGTQYFDGMMQMARSSGWWWPYENLCILTERPTELHRDNRGRLHNETGMAIKYPDGWGMYAWHGILVPEYAIVLTEEITFDQIESETNAEVRRVLIERFGLDNYLRAGKCIKIHQDKCGTLYRMALRGDEPILVVQVVNSTPEPDGIFKEYFLRVPPTMQRARQAVAWTFGLSEDEYFPLAET